MTKVKINLLGGLAFVGLDDANLSRKVKAVAAFLALQQGQPQSREKIAALFWENSPEEQARTNLRQCLSSLRKQLKEALITRGDLVQLDSKQIELDAARFEELITSQNPQQIEDAISIYEGDLLDGFSIKEEGFESWLRPERERLRNLMIVGLSMLIGSKEAISDQAAVTTLAARLLVLDPINEAAHCNLMRAYAVQGRHEAALKQFETCKQTLERELGVAPKPQTIEAFNEIRQQRTGVRQKTYSKPNALVVDVASEYEALGVEFSLPANPSIVLLPFKDLSPQGELAHLAEGIRIDVQSALVKISGLFVIAAGTAEVYQRQNVEPEQVAKELGVQYVLNASIQGNADRIRLTAQLIDGLGNNVVWNERYDRTLDDQFLLQDELAERIVTSLDVALVRGEQARVWRKTFRSQRALQLYYRGLELLTNFDNPSVAAARQLFERVSEISPGVALGPTLVAFCYYWDATMGWSSDTDASLDRAAQWSEKASAMDDADGQAHIIMAHVKLLRGEHEAALKVAQEAVKIRPLCANTNALYGNILVYCGQPKEAADRVKSAIRSAPVYASWWVEILAAAYRDMGLNESAIGAINQLLSKRPNNTNGIATLISALVANGEMDLAKDQAIRLLNVEPDFTLSRYARQHPYKDRRKLDAHLASLRTAGLPE